MNTKTENYLIRCDEATAEYLKSEIKKIEGVTSRENDIKGIGGATEYILFGTAALGAIKALLDVIKAAIEAGRALKSIKVGEREIAAPKSSNISELKKQIMGKEEAS